MGSLSLSGGIFRGGARALQKPQTYRSQICQDGRQIQQFDYQGLSDAPPLRKGRKILLYCLRSLLRWVFRGLPWLTVRARLEGDWIQAIYENPFI